MHHKVQVSVDPTSLRATIIYEGANPRVANELSVTMRINSDNLETTTSGFIVPWHEFKRALVSIGKILRREKVGVEFDEFALFLLNNFADDRKYYRENKSYIDIDERELDSLLLEIGFERKLKPEQKRDTIKLLSLKHGANFSVPGAGKTTTILAVHSILKYYQKVEKLFVVSPINAFISWEDEIKEIFGNSPPKVLRLKIEYINNFSEIESIQPDVILVNYEKIRRDIHSLLPLFTQYKTHLVLDESHRIKSGENNLSYLQIIRLSDVAKRRDILSGTPMPQSYNDLGPQFDFLWTERVLPDLAYIKEREEKIHTINKTISGKFVRTTKNELGLKDPIIDYKYIQMGSIQDELYKLFKSEAARIVSGMDRHSKVFFRSVGRSVVRLLQAATNPMLLGTEDEYMDDPLPIPPGSEVWELLSEFAKYEKPVKVEYLKDRVKTIIDQNPTNKVVVWSYFVRNILLLESILKTYNPVSIYGAVPSGSDEDENKREGRIRKFHEDPTCRVMIANPQACGEGISLHKVCHYAIYLDRNFNAAHFLQSIDRIHRLGLDNLVETKVEILISENTIDEVIIRRLNQKTEAMGRVLDDPYLLTLAYDPADIPLSEEAGLDERDIEEIRMHVLEK